LIELNSLSPAQAQQRLYACFASHRWARLVALGLPYSDLAGLLEAAEQAWSALEPADWADALAGHPRIGESGGASPVKSEREQSRIRNAPAATLDLLAGENRRYEEHFGYVFLIAAAGRTADEILRELRQRMGNDPVTEASVAAAEHRKIARLRLQEMFQE
jgi:OHCU decarboxylase